MSVLQAGLCFLCVSELIHLVGSWTDVLCVCSFRCGLSGGPGLPPGLGHLVLDQLNYLHHHQTNCGPGTSRCFQPAGRGHSLGGRSSTCPGPGWVSKVSSSSKSLNSLFPPFDTLSHIFIYMLLFIIYYHSGSPSSSTILLFFSMLMTPYSI